MPRKEPPELPANPDDWRPQRFGRAGRRNRDVIIEPSWGGVRVLARFEGGATRLVDEDGVDCTLEFAQVAEAIAAAALADELVLDGFLTVEPTQEVAGKPMVEIEAPSAGQMMVEWVAGNRVAQRSKPTRPLDPDRPIAFVAVDLLRIDGSTLLQVPLLERKRLLDGSLQQGNVVRITPYIRPPVGSFLATWRGLGFAALAYKGENSRYTPDARNDDWSIVAMPLK
jgi:bifunctional non-homologous end joining protein LigD